MSVKPVLARNKQHCDTHMAQCAPRMGRRDGKYDLPLAGPDAGVAFHVWDMAHSPTSRAARKQTMPLSFLVPDRCSSPNRGCAIKTRTAFAHRFAYDAGPVCYCRSEQNQTTQRRGFISRISGKAGDFRTPNVLWSWLEEAGARQMQHAICMDQERERHAKAENSSSSGPALGPR
jgi:hypothetical protein